MSGGRLYSYASKQKLRSNFSQSVKKWHEDGRTTVPLVEFVEFLIPCILHLENRVGEKLITMILRHGERAHQWITLNQCRKFSKFQFLEHQAHRVNESFL
jgi:predicted transcriptional regulator